MSTTTVKPFILGGMASLTAEVGTFPIDTTKTRLQVQGQRLDRLNTQTRYRGMLHALSRITQEEGFQALYKGLAPALLRQASYGTLKIGFYNNFKRLLRSRPNDEFLLTNIVAGMLSGAISSAIANPTDVLKVRMQSGTSGTVIVRQSCLKSFRQIYSEEGLRGLYRGVGPTTQRAAVLVGVLLPSYDYSKKILLESWGREDDSTTHFVASFIAGLLGTAATNPIDVVKSRMMNQAVTKPTTLVRAPIATPTGAVLAATSIPATGPVLTTRTHVYKSSLDCFFTTLRTEGPLALYKGFFPSYLRLGPWNIIFFIMYEKLKVIF